MPEVIVTLLEPHEAQREILRGAKRFNVIKNGVRWGKTVLATYLLAQTALKGYPAAYWCPTYKDLFEVWDGIKLVLRDVTQRKSEEFKQLRLITGGKIDFWSMENPLSGSGRKYKRAVVDECEKAPKFKQAWEHTIRTRLTDYQGDAWFFSTPKGAGTYFDKLSQNHLKFDDWTSWQMPTSTNPYMSKSEIEAERLQFDPLIFRQEYLGESIALGNKPFMYCFDKSKLVFKDVPFNPKYPVYLSFDFNVDPATCLIAQIDPNFIHILDEIRLMNSDTYEICEHIRTSKYGNCHFIITGDASGMARNTVTRGNINNYTIILSELRCSEGQLKLPSANPPISESRTLCNAILSRHPNVMIAESCRYFIEDCQYVQVKDDNSIDKTSNAQRTHLLDTFRYLMNSFKPEFILYNR